MKILIIGADGQLGTDLCKVIPKNEQIPLTIKELDITVREKTHKIIRKYAPDIVINTAAYNNVNEAESNIAAAFSINVFGAQYLTEACRMTGATLAHFSTDYVFDGEKKTPYVESDAPNPQSVYAISKYAGEQIVTSSLKKYFIIRTAGLYGTVGCLGKGGANFVEEVLKRAAAQPELKIVTDEVLSPTYTFDLAHKINELIRTPHYGLFHIVNHGSCSWYEFTVKLFELLGRKVKIDKTTAAEWQSKVRRPSYSVLENANLANLGLDDLRPWQEALKAYLIEKGHLVNK